MSAGNQPSANAAGLPARVGYPISQPSQCAIPSAVWAVMRRESC